jgi:acyl-CoA reductase-like NAD-dependent aldehyde dehydrogenase
VLEGVSFDSELWRHEVFGPIVALQRIDTLEEAVSLANDPEYSLHAGTSPTTWTPRSEPRRRWRPAVS